MQLVRTIRQPEQIDFKYSSFITVRPVLGSVAMTNQQSASTQPDTSGVDSSGEIDVEITVGDEQFETVDEAEAFVQEQQKRAAVACVRDEIEEMMGADAPDALVEFITPEDDDTMTFEDIALDLIEESAFSPPVDEDASAEFLTGAMLSGLGKRGINLNVKYC